MGVNSLTRDTLANTVKYNTALAGNDTADIALSSDFLISEVVLNGTATSVTFDVSTLAAQGYKHLQLRSVANSSLTTSGGVTILSTRFNADSGSNYSRHALLAVNTSVSSAAATNLSYAVGGLLLTGTESAFFSSICDILNAFSTTTNKTLRTFTGCYGSGNREISLHSSAWRNTAAITSITLTDSNGDPLRTGSRFSLYGSKG